MNERRKLTMDRERNESIAGISTLSIESDRSTRGSPIVVVGQRLKLDDGEDQNAQGDGGSEPPPANAEPRVDAVSQHRLQVVVKTVRAVQPGHLQKRMEQVPRGTSDATFRQHSFYTFIVIIIFIIMTF